MRLEEVTISHPVVAIRYVKTKDQVKPKARFRHHDKHSWKCDSIAEMFEDPEGLLDHLGIEKEQRYNLFFTLAHTNNRVRRTFISQDVIGFDIDLEGKRTPDEDEARKVFHLACGVLDVDPSETAGLMTGHGVQLIIQLKETITDATFFEKYMAHYKELCRRIEQRLDEHSISAGLDTVFDSARIFRLPGTHNAKPNLPVVKTIILNANMSEQDFPWPKIKVEPRKGKQTKPSEAPSADHTDPMIAETLPLGVMAKWPKVDVKAVTLGCNEWVTLTDPKYQSEPRWYNLAGLASHMGDAGREAFHDLSASHDDYNESDVDEKMNQWKAKYGPPKCTTIENKGGACEDCEWKGKVYAPIQIVGVDFIKTEEQGFHTITREETTDKIKKIKPNPDDLMKFFRRNHEFQSISGTSITYIHKDNYWQSITKDYLEAFAESHYKREGDSILARECEEFRKKVNRNRKVQPSWFNGTTKGFVNFKNGVLDLKTKELLPHDTKFGFRYVLPYGYLYGSGSGKWENFIHDITEGDTQVGRILQEFAGYTVCGGGDYRWHKALVLYGPTASNGKSTYVDMLKRVIGESNAADVPLQELSHATRRLLLEGKLANFSRETDANSLKSSEMFKLMSEGGEMTVKQLYHGEYTVNNTAKMFLLCNDLPKSSDKTDGLYRRLLIVPFNAKFQGKKMDVNIQDKLSTELPGIFNWCMEGYDRLLSQGGFSEAKSSEAALVKYKTDNDSVLDWIKTCVTKLPDATNEDYIHFVTKKQLYINYKAFMDDNGMAQGRNKFLNQLDILWGPAKENKENRGHSRRSVRGWPGVVLRHEL